jgi:hypothetical protein
LAGVVGAAAAPSSRRALDFWRKIWRACASGIFTLKPAASFVLSEVEARCATPFDFAQGER